MATRYELYTPPDRIMEVARSLPEKPGVYQFYNVEGKIIYVGKAKSLKKRVLSYFQKNPDSAKLAVLVRKIHAIQHIVVNTESDALLLENNLIKQHQPRYNVLLKDDKTYPWICVKQEPFPRVFTTRQIIRDGSRYFGPYTSGKIWKNIIELIRQLYKVRTCSMSLTPENIKAGKFKVCLEFHLGNCLGPCVGYQTEESYQKQVEEIVKILNGNSLSVIHSLKKEMKELAASYQFEQANALKEKIMLLEKFQSKSAVSNTRIKHVDVFSITTDDRAGYVNYMKVINGALIQAHSIELKKRLNETESELLSLAVYDLRNRFSSDAPEIIVPVTLDYPADNVKITVPRQGDKKSLLDLSLKNALYFKYDRQKQQVKQVAASSVSRKLEVLRKDLRLSDLPVHIECFDNSNTQGTNPVAACVVFRNAAPSKKDYRHFNIKTVIGPDDFASMEEVVYRRYRRMMDEGTSLPQLIIVDGGKGQLSAAMKSLEKLGLRNKVALVGIAKRLEEIYFPDDPVPLYLDKKSESLRIIQQMRDEAHRFGITHHRKKREKGITGSLLDEIKGVGEQTRNNLLQVFGSVERIRNASLEEIAQHTGLARARKIREFFDQKDK